MKKIICKKIILSLIFLNFFNFNNLISSQKAAQKGAWYGHEEYENFLNKILDNYTDSKILIEIIESNRKIFDDFNTKIASQLLNRPDINKEAQLKALNIFLEKKMDPNGAYDTSNTLLSTATQDYNIDFTALLLKYKANVNIANSYNKTLPLQFALGLGSLGIDEVMPEEEVDQDFVKLLLQAKANPYLYGSEDSDQLPLLTICAKYSRNLSLRTILFHVDPAIKATHHKQIELQYLLVAIENNNLEAINILLNSYGKETPDNKALVDYLEAEIKKERNSQIIANAHKRYSKSSNISAIIKILEKGKKQALDQQ